MAEDVVREAFLSLWRDSASYDRRGGSVRSLVHDRAVDSFHRGFRREGRDTAEEEPGERTQAPQRNDVLGMSHEAAHEVRSALGALPVGQRRVIELAYFGGFTHTEISVMLKLSTGTVKRRMRLGLTNLRIVLGGPPELVS